MRVIKRNESEQDFCLDKIEKAIMKANSTVGDEDKMNDDAIQKVLSTVQKKLTGFNSVKVEDIQDFVEQALVRHNKYAVAKSYILYRDNKKRGKKFTENEEKVLALIDGVSSLRGDNANKHIDDNASIRDYIAGIMCKSLANKTLPKDIIKAHNEGIIHWHDADYSPTQPLHNCFSSSQKFITDCGIRKLGDFSDGEKVIVKDYLGELREATVHVYEPQRLYDIELIRKKEKQSVIVTATKDHKWLLADGKFTTELSVGDKLWQNKCYDVKQKIETIDDARSWCLGFVIGDGSVDIHIGDTKDSYMQCRLRESKKEYTNIFNKAGYRMKYVPGGDVISYIKYRTVKDFLNGKSWRYMTAKHKALVFEGLYASCGIKNKQSIKLSDQRVIPFVEECSGLAGYFIIDKDEDYNSMDYIKNGYSCTFTFLPIQRGDDYWVVNSIIQNSDENPLSRVYCVNEPITHTFTLDKGIVTGNCDVYDLENMFKYGFVMGDTKIEPNEETPFRTMVNLAAQAALLISGRQYGGQTMSWIHLVPFVDQSRKIIRKKILQDFESIGATISEENLNTLTERKVREEIAEGVKIYQYQILCHSSANGQTPFVSNNMCLRESMTKRELDDFALIIEEILKRRIKGVKDPSGNFISPLFPKLLYWTCDGLNVKKGDPYYYLTELAAKCIAKRMQPDIVSESQTRKYKQGQIIPCMGCVDKDDVVTYKYKDAVYTESIKRMWNRFSSEFDVKLQDATDCYYIDLTGVCIYDSKSNGFVDCLRINKNKDQGDWKLVKLSNGRSLTCTSDHPLAVIGKGRTEVKDLCIDDEIEATNFAYSAESENVDPEYAWLLATIMCDGCYDRQLSSTFAMNGEDDIIERYSNAVEKYFGLGTVVKEWHRGAKGEYKEVKAVNGKSTIKETQEKLKDIFGGLRKKERSIPSFIIHANKEARVAFMAGIVDADGYIHKSEKHFNNIEVGSTNKEISIQTMYLANTLGYDAKMSLNHYTSSDPSKIRYKIYFNTNDEIVDAITCQKKKNNYEVLNRINPRDKHYVVTDIIDLGYRDEYSYDVTTGSDRFDVSGIQSHNCRSLLGPIWEERTYPIDTKFFWTEGGTYPYDIFIDDRTFESVPNGEYSDGYDNGKYCINFRGNTGWLIRKTDTEVTVKEPIVYGRWNNGVITINLPYVALESKEKGIDFYENLDRWLEVCRHGMQERVKSCEKIKAKNSPILWMYGALARLEPEQTVGDLMEAHPNRPTVSLGYVGLYETVQALINESNTTDNGRKLCKEIMTYINNKIDQWFTEGEFNEGDLTTISNDEEFEIDE